MALLIKIPLDDGDRHGWPEILSTNFNPETDKPPEGAIERLWKETYILVDGLDVKVLINPIDNAYAWEPANAYDLEKDCS
jgi:hypothetical protein